MGVDLSARLNEQQWTKALATCVKAARFGWLNDVEFNFVKDMQDEFQMNGNLMEPSIKQFNWLKQIAYENREAES